MLLDGCTVIFLEELSLRYSLRVKKIVVSILKHGAFKAYVYNALFGVPNVLTHLLACFIFPLLPLD